MNLEDLPKFAALLKELQAIEAMLGTYGLISRARQVPGDRERAVTAMRFETSGYGHRPDPETVAVAERMKATVAAEERRRGEAERAAALKKIEMRVERVRAALPSMAGSAAVELSALSKSLR